MERYVLSKERNGRDGWYEGREKESERKRHRDRKDPVRCVTPLTPAPIVAQPHQVIIMLTAADHDDSAQGGTANEVPCHCRIAHNGNQSGRWFSMVVTQIFCWLCISRPASIALGLVAGRRVKEFYRDKVREKKDRLRQRVSSTATDVKHHIKDRLGAVRDVVTDPEKAREVIQSVRDRSLIVGRGIMGAIDKGRSVSLSGVASHVREKRNSVVSSVKSMASTGQARSVNTARPPTVCAQETEMVSIERTTDATGAAGAARATSETFLDDDTANNEESMCVTLNVRTASVDLDDVCNEGRESKDDATAVESKGYDGDGGGISEIVRSPWSTIARRQRVQSVEELGLEL